MKTYLSHPRIINGLAFLACCCLLMTAFYLQWAKGIEPCPLCMVQRMVFALLALCFLVEALHNPKTTHGVWGYSSAVLLCSSLGALAAGRQLWLSAHPNAGPEVCFPGFANIFNLLPPTQALQVIFHTRENCIHANEQILGLSIATWCLLVFLLFGGLAIWQGVRSKRVSQRQK